MSWCFSSLHLVSELARFPATVCGRTGVPLSMKKELDIKCGHFQTEENWRQHTTATQILCRGVNFGICSYYFGVSSTHNSDISLTVSTWVVPGGFNRTTQVPLAGHKHSKNLGFLLWYPLINRILNSSHKRFLKKFFFSGELKQTLSTLLSPLGRSWFQ